MTERTLEAAARDFVASLNVVVAAEIDADARFAENLTAGGRIALIQEEVRDDRDISQDT